MNRPHQHPMSPAGVVPPAAPANPIGAGDSAVSLLAASLSNLQTEAAGAPFRLTLPSWANNDEARALLVRIVAEQPEPRLFASSNDDAAYGTVYRGRNANLLRKIHGRHGQALCDAERQAWEQGRPHSELTRMVGDWLIEERPDVLIARVLGEAR